MRLESEAGPYRRTPAGLRALHLYQIIRPAMPHAGHPHALSPRVQPDDKETNMEHKNTPGPWEAECRSGDWVAISARDKNAVAWPNRPRGNEVEANVRLIAAAPELLEALQRLVEIED